MVTDAPPRKKNRNLFTESDRVNTLGLPTDNRLRRIATAIEAAMKIGKTPGVLALSREFLDTAADFYHGNAVTYAYSRQGLCASKSD